MAQAQNQNQPDGAVVINMNELTPNEKKKDTLFGPNIGITSTGPKWTEHKEKSVDELTPEIIKSWIEKSKQPNHTTTTLQALVNLKRPTLRLSPLASEDPDASDSGPQHHHHHGLEFEYDCDAPKCGIYVHVVLSPSHPLADKTLGPNQQTKLLVFEMVTEGGFGKLLKLEEGAMLELGRYEHIPGSMATTTAEEPETAALSDGTSGNDDSNNSTHARQRRRFTNFHFRRTRSQPAQVTGPALQVVDDNAQATANANNHESNGAEDESELGVKVMIRLSALDESGRTLSCPNEQVTYLHVVRYGPPPPPPPTETEPEEDKRPWVVKVVKREATVRVVSLLCIVFDV
ncbi:hypothetical protein K474DRAFT_1660519 [Panus rudis PR-1116 ss-1]|nr:hypothetical protein K474DRAFT_1660519 [Panus rudis PR-1116 ss-1]